MEALKTLIIDDDIATCSLIQTILEKEEYQTSALHKIADDNIIAILEQEQPNILILDYHLKGKETLPYLPLIRNHSTWQHLAILMISAIDRSQECLAAGANGFILKPFDWQDISKAIKNLTREVLNP
jgi:DNA-binding response OmpR family regulator